MVSTAMSDAIDRALSENHSLIAAILEHQSSGRTVPAVALLERLQVNLEYIASVAEHGLPLDQHHQTNHNNNNNNNNNNNTNTNNNNNNNNSNTNNPSIIPHLSQQQQQQQQQPPIPSIPISTHPIQPSTITHRPPTVTPIVPAPQFPLSNPLSTTSNPSHSIQPATMYWTPDEHARFEEGMRLYGASGKDGKPNFKAIAAHVGSRTPVQVRSHHQKFQKKLDRQSDIHKPSQSQQQQQQLLPSISQVPVSTQPTSTIQPSLPTTVSTPIPTNTTTTTTTTTTTAIAQLPPPPPPSQPPQPATTTTSAVTTSTVVNTATSQPCPTNPRPPPSEGQ